MTNRILLRGVIKGLAEAAFPKVKVISGTPSQVAKVELERDQVLIATYSDFKQSREDVESSTERISQWGFFVGLLDNLDDGPNSYENALDTAEVLGEQLLKDLEEAGLDIGFRLSSIEKAPNGKIGSESTTGLWFIMTVDVSGCGINQWPDLSEYMNEISQRVSPYDWQGITQNIKALQLR